jgi:hypothetical protein
MAAEMYEIERIVDGPNEKGQYFIKWEGFPDDQNTWEPLDHLPKDMVEEYLNPIAELKTKRRHDRPTETQQKSKRKRVAGVDIAKVVDDSNYQGDEPAHTPRIPKGMGRSSVVLVVGKFLIPQAPLRAVDPNTYLKKVYEMVVTGWGRHRIRNENAYVLILEPGRKHDGEGLGLEKFHCRFAHAKIEHACPPNQIFKASDFVKAAVPAVEADAESSSDVEESSDDEGEEEDGNDDERPVWERMPDESLKFREDMTTCWRMVAEPSSLEHPPSLLHTGDPSVHEAEWFSDYFFPMEWWKHDVIPAWSENLASRGQKPTSVGEANVWRGLWRWMSLNPQYKRNDFWDTSLERVPYMFDPPPFGKYMSRNRFDELTSSFKLRRGSPPPYRDKFWEIRQMQDSFNDHMKKCFSAAWAVCLDESMVKWLNEFSPGWMAVGRKPSPFGNEYHTMACAVLHVIFWIEIVEGKDRPPHLGPLLHVEAHGKLCGLVLRAAEAIKGSNRVIGMDSGFGVLATLPELRKRGLHGTVVLKKKKYWAKGLPGDEILEALRMADVGTTKVLVGKFKGEKIWIGCQVDSKHTTLIGNTWSTTERNGKKKKRKVGGRLVEFNYCAYQNTWYWIRHAVDDANHNRAHPLPLEDTINTKDWVMRQFTFIDAMCECNAKQAYNYWVRKKQSKPLMTNIQFRHARMMQLVNNSEWAREKQMGQSTFEDKSIPGPPVCKLKHYEKGRGEWDVETQDYKIPAQEYQKYFCKWTKQCKNKVRTYCACEPQITLCIECYPDHVLSKKD